MCARLLVPRTQMGGKIVPVLKIEWTVSATQPEAGSSRSGVPLRGKLMPAQKLLMLVIVPAWHWVNVALVDVSRFIENETYVCGARSRGSSFDPTADLRLIHLPVACLLPSVPRVHHSPKAQGSVDRILIPQAGGNLVSVTVGWSLAMALILVVDHRFPWLLERLQGTASRILFALLAFELLGLLMQDKTSSALTSGNVNSGQTIRSQILKGVQFTYFLFAAMGQAERGGGSDMAMPAALAVSFLSTHLGCVMLRFRIAPLPRP